MFFRQLNLIIIIFIAFLLVFPFVKPKLTGGESNRSMLSMMLVSLGIGSEAYQAQRQVLMNNALASYREKDFEKAIALYEKIYKMDQQRADTPSSVQVADLKTIAKLYYANGDVSKSAAVFERAKEQMLLAQAEYVMGNGSGHMGALSALLDLRQDGNETSQMGNISPDVKALLSGMDIGSSGLNKEQLEQLFSSLQQIKQGDSVQSLENSVNKEGLPDELKTIMQTLAAQQIMSKTDQRLQNLDYDVVARMAVLKEQSVNSDLNKRNPDDFESDAKKFEEAASRLREIANMGGVMGGSTELPALIRNNPMMKQLFPGAIPDDLNGLIKMLQDKANTLKADSQPK